jgi:hypothetical protein
MALSGLQIQKLLPKTNCKECGCSTCLAFAMKLAAKKAELKECPYASEEAKAVLGAAAEPPIRTVTVGSGDGAIKAGGETVMYRHEKTFVSPTGLGVAVSDAWEPDRLERAVRMRGEPELRGALLLEDRPPPAVQPREAFGGVYEDHPIGADGDAAHIVRWQAVGLREARMNLLIERAYVDRQRRMRLRRAHRHTHQQRRQRRYRAEQIYLGIPHIRQPGTTTSLQPAIA